MSQPKWQCIAQLGDVGYVDYGGYFVLVDTTGVYPPEVEVLEPPTDDDWIAGRYTQSARWTVYRFVLEACTFVNGILSDNQFHPDHPAWFANPHGKGEQYVVLGDLASFGGADTLELIRQFTSADPLQRACAWRLIGEYHGFHELDQYPLALRQGEVTRRYRKAQYKEVAK